MFTFASILVSEGPIPEIAETGVFISDSFKIRTEVFLKGLQD